MSPTIDINDLGLDRGAHLLIKRALRSVAVGERIGVRGSNAELAVHLPAWCRAQGHSLTPAEGEATWWIVRGSVEEGRWRDAERAGEANPSHVGAVVNSPKATWGLAARGATVEAGGPPALHACAYTLLN